MPCNFSVSNLYTLIGTNAALGRERASTHPNRDLYGSRLQSNKNGQPPAMQVSKSRAIPTQLGHLCGATELCAPHMRYPFHRNETKRKS
jgi:hypothetical protein